MDHKEYNKMWRIENREYDLERKREWYKKNKETELLKAKKRRDENPEKYISFCKNNRINNPQKIREIKQLRYHYGTAKVSDEIKKIHATIRISVLAINSRITPVNMIYKLNSIKEGKTYVAYE